MKQSTHLSPNPLELLDKDHTKKKSIQKDYQPEISFEDFEKSLSSQHKPASHFDFSNFGVFFKHKASHSRSSKDSSASRFHIKKKSNETSSSKESTLKRMSSKDFSNLEDLYENTTVITNPAETKPYSKQVSNEVSFTKILVEDDMEASSGDLSESFTEKKKMKGVVHYGNNNRLSKEERYEQGAIGGIKLGFIDDWEEHKKTDTPTAGGIDIKLPKSGFNAEVIERIKTKALPGRRISGSNLAINNSGLNNISGNSGTSNSASTPQNDVRTNNNSIFTGWKQSNKEGLNKKITMETDLNDPIRATVSALFSPLGSESLDAKLKSEKQVQIQEGGMKGNGGVVTSLLTKSVEVQEFAQGLEKTAKKKPNLSTIATDSTLDSDHITTINFNYQNNSFSTPFSGTSNSFNNSGKVDLNSPFRLDSGRLIENLHASLTGHSNQTNVQPTPNSVPVQKSLFNLGQNLTGFYGGVGSGNNTDRSTSLSWNEDYAVSNFSSALSTPQGMQQKSFFNRDFTSQPNTKDQHNMNTSQQIGPQTTRNVSSSNYTQSEQGLNQSFSSNSTTNALEKNASAGKESKSNSHKHKKKGQDNRDSHQFEVDVNKIEYNSRTTLMIKNIPNKYDLLSILQTIEKNHKGKFDFFYLPIDPRNKCNVGYAFINFTETKHIKNFYLEFQGAKWKKYNSEKICDIKYARIQGKKALMHHFQYSNVMNQQDKKLRPYIPDSDVFDQKIKQLVTKQRLESSEDYE